LNVPGAKLELVDGAGHSPMAEHPAKTVAFIKEFLAAAP
jgi:pimeloyl-ACP methyl ester carboxylesterase